MGKGRDKRKKAVNDREGGRNKAKQDKRAREKNLEKKGKREQYDEEGELKEADIEALLEQYRKKEKKKKEVVIEECDAPSPRINAAFASNPMNSSELVLFGGEYWNGERTDSYNDLYRFNTDRLVWRSVSSPSSPSPRSSHQIVTYKNYLVTYGGEFTSPSQSQFYHHKDLWRLDLNSWEWEEIKLKEKGSPQPRSGHRMVLWKRSAVMFGGFHDTLTSAGQYFDDTWVLSNLDALPQWKRIDATTGEKPSKRSAVNLCVYGDTMFLYGGFCVQGKEQRGTSYNDLWSLNLLNNTWTRVKKVGIPPAIRSGMSVCVSARKAIFFGGVMDYEEKEDVKSRFFNDMYVFNMESKRWFPLVLKKKKAPGGKRRKKQTTVSSAQSIHEKEEEEQTEAGSESDEEDEEDIVDVWDRSAMPKLSAAKKKKRQEQGGKKKAGTNPPKKADHEEEEEKVDENLGVPIYLGSQIVGYERKEEPVPELVPADTAEEEEEEEEEEPDFIPCEKFGGSKAGYVFKMDTEGLGYYKDVKKVVTFDLSNVKERSKKTYKANDAGQLTPCGRFGSQLAVMGNYLYLYGGQFEEGTREVTLSDMFRVNLNALETFEVVQEMDLTKQEWYESDDEGEGEEEDEEEMDNEAVHGEADGEGEEEEEDEEGDDEDKPPGAAGEGKPAAEGEGSAPAATAAKTLPKKIRIRSKRDELRAKLGAHEGIPTPDPHQALRDFFTASLEFWLSEAKDAAQYDRTAADASKAIRKAAFQFASVRYNECRPILEQIEYLDEQEKKEAAWRDKKAADAREKDRAMQKLQRRVGGK